MTGRKDVSDNDKIDPAVLTPADTSSIEIEVDTHTPAEKLEHKNRLIKEGFATAEILNEKPIIESTCVYNVKFRSPNLASVASELR